MFTNLMYEKLADWFINASILSLATLVIPALLGRGDLKIHELLTGAAMMVLCLWVGLRYARLASRGGI